MPYFQYNLFSPDSWKDFFERCYKFIVLILNSSDSCYHLYHILLLFFLSISRKRAWLKIKQEAFVSK